MGSEKEELLAALAFAVRASSEQGLRVFKESVMDSARAGRESWVARVDMKDLPRVKEYLEALGDSIKFHIEESERIATIGYSFGKASPRDAITKDRNSEIAISWFMGFVIALIAWIGAMTTKVAVVV